MRNVKPVHRFKTPFSQQHFSMMCIWRSSAPFVGCSASLMGLLALQVILDLPSVLVHSTFSTRCQSIDPQREMKAPFRDLEVHRIQDERRCALISRLSNCFLWRFSATSSRHLQYLKCSVRLCHVPSISRLRVCAQQFDVIDQSNVVVKKMHKTCLQAFGSIFFDELSKLPTSEVKAFRSRALDMT